MLGRKGYHRAARIAALTQYGSTRAGENGAAVLPGKGGIMARPQDQTPEEARREGERLRARSEAADREAAGLFIQQMAELAAEEESLSSDRNRTVPRTPE